MNQKILFVHGRPAGHPLHAKYGKSITDDFHFEDPWIRWHDRNYPFFIRYFAWIVNSFAFFSLTRKIVVTEGFRLTLVLSKLMSFNRLKLVMLVADESPYFLYSKYYSRLSLAVNKWGYNQYDAFICIGDMETLLVNSVLRNDHRKQVLTSINGVSTRQLAQLKENYCSTESNKIVFVGNGGSQWRLWYKGLDIMLLAFSKISEINNKATFEIAGDWDSKLLTPLLANSKGTDRIKFLGHVKSVQDFFNDAALYLHIGRGDAWPISIMEAMAAGVVPIVSEWTGAKECVEQVSPQLIMPLDSEKIYERIKWFLQLPSHEKQMLSKKCKEIASLYTEEKAVAKFKECFDQIASQLVRE